MPLKLGVLLSGGGSTLQNLMDHIAQGQLDAEVAAVVSSRADAYGLERARSHGIPAILCARKAYGGWAAFDRAVWAALEPHAPDLVVLAGFMSLISVPPAYTNRIVNVHPALIPAFCGQGMYGHHVHEAVLAYGAKVSGCTVHFVDTEYDHGPIIAQSCVPVLDSDTPDALAGRVMAKERELYPQAIQWIAQGRVRVDGRRVRID